MPGGREPSRFKNEPNRVGFFFGRICYNAGFTLSITQIEKELNMDSKTYAARRATLRNQVGDGAILLVGQDDASRNYPANTYPFRQDSHFLYYVGTNLPGMAALLLPDGDEILFGPGEDPDDLVWHGPHPILADHAKAAGIQRTEETGQLKSSLQGLKNKGLSIHFLPPYRGKRVLLLSDLLSATPGEIATGASEILARAVVEQRSVKTEAEVSEIEEALKISAEMYAVAMKATRSGIKESEIAGAMQGVALKSDRAQSFLPIVSVRGEVLHNTSYENTLQNGDLLLIDSGTESQHFYASDITRTIPVSGRYTDVQKDVYQIVLSAQQAAIDAASPALSNRDLHLIAAKTIATGLTDIGLMSGDPEEAVQSGAHALFFPHGLGHMLGLDVHDMEDLGDVVGYGKGESRSKQFGLSFLRLAKKLLPGYVLTFEPGIYFVPALMDRWAKEQKHSNFINYSKLEAFRSFGGIRIEDDILITQGGCRVLGTPIPKSIDEVENAMAR